jgi:hypothetical protein
MKKTRTPNWLKWGAVPVVKIWEGVALSLDIDPDSIDREYSSKAEATITKAIGQYGDRLFVATRNVRRHPMLQPVALEVCPSEELTVKLSDFASFAMSLGWEIPSQLATLVAPGELHHAFSEALPGGITAADAMYDERLREMNEGSPTSRPSAETRRINTLQKLVLAMAMAQYGWRQGARNSATGSKAGSIYADVIKHLGETHSVDEDTIRDVLEQAAKDFPPLPR